MNDSGVLSAWTSVDCSARPGASFLGCRGRKAWLGGHEFPVTYGQGAGGCVVDKGLLLGVGCQGVSVPSCLPGAQIPVTLSRAGEELQHRAPALRGALPKILAPWIPVRLCPTP